MDVKCLKECADGLTRHPPQNVRQAVYHIATTLIAYRSRAMCKSLRQAFIQTIRQLSVMQNSACWNIVQPDDVVWPDLEGSNAYRDWM